ncbi:MAG: hypothetical protein NT093_03415 [Candidatus Moranbacteria bacterium]|nr:hypothetical protein [Candidatus Moranbacteria bacterium]
MQEDFQKKFILLSKIAKDKKYAQEYMGLLARRGDIGSIRIGKRWYTTWEWFEEFLENSQKKKTESISEVKISQPVKVEAEKTICPASKKEEIKISVPFVFPEREKVYAAHPVMRVQREEKNIEDSARISVSVKTGEEKMIGRKNIAVGLGDIRLIRKIGEKREIRKKAEISQTRIFLREKNSQSIPQMETRFKNVFVEKKNENPLPYKEIKFRKNQDVFSPAFGVGEKTYSSFFPRLVFATGFAIIFLLVAASGYFVFSDGIFEKGTVAGASNERNGGFPGIDSGGEYFFASTGDKMKESLSVSRVVIEAVKEKTTNNSQ